MRLLVNGDPLEIEIEMSVKDFLISIELDPTKVAVERNLEIVSKSTYADTLLKEGDALEIVHFIGGGNTKVSSSKTDSWQLAGQSYNSRLIVGTGKYKDFEQTAEALEASGAEIVTVAVRRVNVSDPKQPMLVDYVDPKKITYLPNTAGCFDAASAVDRKSVV